MTDAGPLVVFGSSGFIGNHLVSTLKQQAGEVVVVSRRIRQPLDGVRAVVSDVADPTRLASELPKGGVVINLAYDAEGTLASNLALADGLAEVCRRVRAARLVHLSTAMVVGPVKDRWIDENTTCRPRTSYQRNKLAVEERLNHRLTGVTPTVVIRPTAVFGAGGLNLVKLYTDLATQPAYRNYLRACLFGNRPMNLVPVETVVSAVVFAAHAPAAVSDRLYYVADDESLENNFRAVEATMRRGIGSRPLPVAPILLPPALLRIALKLSGKLSVDPRARFSSARILSAGFTRPLTFIEALRRYVEHVASTQPQA